jgi:hypothetical protein
MNFLWFAMVFKKFSQNKKKKPINRNNHGGKVTGFEWAVLRDEGESMSSFRVKGEKTDFHDSWGR